MRFYYCDAKIILKMWMDSQGSEWCSVVWTHSIWFYLLSFSFWVGQINTLHWIQMLNETNFEDKTRHLDTVHCSNWKTLFEQQHPFISQWFPFMLLTFSLFALCTSNHIKRWTTPNHNNNHRKVMVNSVDSVVFSFSTFHLGIGTIYLAIHCDKQFFAILNRK